MTPSAQPDPQYFRGRTLTPESPKPLHIPEPSHIPVLQNQIDPIFNLMSTHMDQPSTIGYTVGLGNGSSQQDPMQAMQANTVAASLNNGVSGQGDLPKGREPDQGDKDYLQAFENEELAEGLAVRTDTDTSPNHSSTSAAQLSASIPALDTITSDPPLDPSSVLSQTHKSPPDSSQATLDPPQPIQAAPTAKGQDLRSAPSPSGDSDDQTQDGGVNYQALLDNLSPSISTAPTAENIASITTVAPSAASNVPRPSSTESPISTLPLPPGLPPRPPPQEKPTIHPNYTTEEDIRSYHYTHVQASSAPTPSVSQPNNPITPIQGLSHPLPPNASIGSNGLPPPPLATFQQPPPQPPQLLQPGPITPQSRQPEAPAQTVDRNAVTLESSQDEPPWPSWLESSYDQFTSEEAKYVAEGVWDRFPHGSRLFVGMYDVVLWAVTFITSTLWLTAT
ncbi:MAG: hypothetical protein L6R39_005264 [Caloplaca ligustica]|nr:MAG: hypothetical protein L6R39_005264 [Caloplaca ligustica]